MRSFRLLAVLLLVIATSGLLGCASAPRQRPVRGGAVETGPSTVAAARNYLEGRWSLVSFEVYPPNAKPITLQGSGVLTYDAYGNLSMQIRVDESTAALLDRAGIASNQGVISTEGRTVVDMQARTLTYVLEGQPPVGAPSGPLATNRPRHWEVEGNDLTLTTKDDSGNPVSVGRWRKEPQG